jgi:regulator of protease activity HflC (stomatin/prohibitin superfamily)
MDAEKKCKFAIGCSCCCLVLIIVCILLGFSFRKVEVDEMALKWGTLSMSLGDKIYRQGRHHVWPAVKFMKFTWRVQTVDLFGGKSLDCYSSDGVLSRVELSYQYRLKPTELRDAVLDFGEQTLIEQFTVRLAQDAIRDACSYYQAEDFFRDREGLTNRMDAELGKRFNASKPHADFIRVVDSNIWLPPGFETAILQKQDAQIMISFAEGSERTEKMLAAREKLIVAGLDRQRALIKAEGLKNATIIAAEDEAEGIRLEFDQIVSKFREYKQTVGLNTLQFARSYLASEAMKRAGLPIYIFEPGQAACTSA